MEFSPSESYPVTEQTDFVPYQYSPYLMAEGNSAYRTHAFGSYLTQTLENEAISYRQTIFHLRGDVELQALEPETCLTLLFAVEGPLQLHLRGHGTVALEEHEYRPVYLPSGMIANMLLARGSHVVSQLRIPVPLLHFLSGHLAKFKTITDAVDTQAQKGIALAKAHITESVSEALLELRRCPDKEPFKTLQLEGKVRNFLADYLFATDGPVHVSDLTLQKMEEIKEFIAGDLSKHHTASDLGRRFAMSERNLNRLFRKACQQSIHQYTLEKRMEKAMELIQEGDMTILEITLALGYNEVANFYKVFVKHYKHPPSHFRTR